MSGPWRPRPGGAGDRRGSGAVGCGGGKDAAGLPCGSDLPCGVYLEWELVKSRSRQALEDRFALEEEFLLQVVNGFLPEIDEAISGGPSRPLAASGDWVRAELYYNKATQATQWEAPAGFPQAPPPSSAARTRRPETLRNVAEARPQPPSVEESAGSGVNTTGRRSGSLSSAHSSQDLGQKLAPSESFSSAKRGARAKGRGKGRGKGGEPGVSSEFDIRKDDFLKDVEERFGASALQCQIAHWGAETAEWWAHLKEPKRTGCLAHVTEHWVYDLVCSAAIIAYSLLMAFLADYMVDTGTAPTWMTGADFGFNLFFCIEVGLRLWVHGRFFFCNDDMAWNIFDIVLVVTSVWENIIQLLMDGTQADINMTFMRSMRLMKMVKALRVLKMVRFVSDLRFMINSVMGSFMSLLWCGIMLLMCFFLFSLAFVQGVGTYLQEDGAGIDDESRSSLLDNFGSVMRSMMTCFRACTGGDDWGNYYDVISPTGFINSFMFFFFILFSQIALLNVVTGVFVENAMKLGQPELNVLAFEQRKRDLEDAERLRDIFRMIDVDDSGTISWREFHQCVQQDARVRASLAVLGLSIKDTEAFFKMLTEASGDEDDDVDLVFFVEACLKMKGNATSIDLSTVAFETKVIHRNLRSFTAEVRHALAHLVANSSGAGAADADFDAAAARAARGPARGGGVGGDVPALTDASRPEARCEVHEHE